MLYWHGIEVVLPEAMGSKAVMVKVMLLQVLADYRGMYKVFRYSTAPAHVGEGKHSTARPLSLLPPFYPCAVFLQGHATFAIKKE